MKQKQTEAPESGASFNITETDSALTDLAERAKALLSQDSFLSYRKLRIRKRQRTALIKTLKLMEAKGISHKKFIDGRIFDMNHWNDPYVHTCGTTCCIGGTASLLAGDDGLFDSYNSISLENLFYEWGGDDVSVKRAAKQLRFFLETGECARNWARYSKPR